MAPVALNLRCMGERKHRRGGTVIPPLIQICIGVVTLAIIALAVVTIRAMKSFERAATEFRRTSESVQQLTKQVRTISASVREMGDVLGDLIPRLKRVGSRFGEIRNRASHLTNGSFEDMRETVRRAASTMRAARELTGLVFRKVAHPSRTIRSNGG